MAQKVVLVTGAGRGIGAGLTQLLSSSYGWTVAAADLSFEDDNKEQENVFNVHMDISDEQSIQSGIQQILSKLGRLDALVNNAAIAMPYCSDTSAAVKIQTWKRVVGVNLTGSYMCSLLCSEAMKEGAIVNIASTRAHQSEPNSEAYAATKGGLVSLTHALAISQGPRVRVNCVSPGWIHTNAHADPESDPSSDDHAFHPCGRVGVPNDIGHMVAFLLDSSRSGFITGQEFVVDGGITKKMIYPE